MAVKEAMDLCADWWAMRTKIANYFGGASAHKEVQDLRPDEVEELYALLPESAR